MRSGQAVFGPGFRPLDLIHNIVMAIAPVDEACARRGVPADRAAARIATAVSRNNTIAAMITSTRWRLSRCLARG